GRAGRARLPARPGSARRTVRALRRVHRPARSLARPRAILLLVLPGRRHADPAARPSGEPAAGRAGAAGSTSDGRTVLRRADPTDPRRLLRHADPTRRADRAAARLP